MAEPNFDGACICGAVRCWMTSTPLSMRCCHCSWRQRESGSAFALNAMIESDRLVLTQGEPELVDTPSNSGNGQQEARCPSGRGAPWSHCAGAGKALAFFHVGTLDEPHRLPPDIHIFTSSKQPCVMLSPEIPATAEYRDRDAHWPATSLARRKALPAAIRRPAWPAANLNGRHAGRRNHGEYD